MKKQNELNNKKGISPAMAGITGVVAGAGLAMAGIGAIVLQDKDNRAKLKKTTLNLKNNMKKHIKGIQENLVEKKNNIQEKISKSVNKADDKVEEVISPVSKN